MLVLCFIFCAAIVGFNWVCYGISRIWMRALKVLPGANIGVWILYYLFVSFFGWIFLVYVLYHLIKRKIKTKK